MPLGQGKDKLQREPWEKGNKGSDKLETSVGGLGNYALQRGGLETTQKVGAWKRLTALEGMGKRPTATGGRERTNRNGRLGNDKLQRVVGKTTNHNKWVGLK